MKDDWPLSGQAAPNIALYHRERSHLDARDPPRSLGFAVSTPKSGPSVAQIGTVAARRVRLLNWETQLKRITIARSRRGVLFGIRYSS